MIFVYICLPRYFHLLAQSTDRFKFLILLGPEKNTRSALKHETPSAGSEGTFLTLSRILYCLQLLLMSRCIVGKELTTKATPAPCLCRPLGEKLTVSYLLSAYWFSNF